MPILQGEKFISPVSATGLMMNCEFASHVEVERGQQLTDCDSHPFAHEHPSAHCEYGQYRQLHAANHLILTSCCGAKVG